MFCNKCGGQLSDTAFFCNCCGAPVKQMQQPVKPLSKSFPQRTEKKIGNIPKPILMAVAGIALVAVVTVALSLSGKPAKNALKEIAEESQTVETQENFAEEITDEESTTLNDECGAQEIIEEPKYSLMVEGGKCDVGNICVLGTYQMDGQAEEENLEWQIVKEEDGRLLLISRYLLPEGMAFNDVMNLYTSAYWDSCTLRTWLNDNFYNAAFNGQEKSIILYSQVGDYDLRIGGNDNYAYDYVFCPSQQEVYLLENIRATQYNSTDYLPWWIRTTGENENVNGTFTAYVTMQGGIEKDGDRNYTLKSVRPAIWIDSNMCKFIPWE